MAAKTSETRAQFLTSLAQAVRDRRERWERGIEEREGSSHNQCWRLAVVAAADLRDFGRTIVQAGSASWPLLDFDQEPFLTYQWQLTDAAILQVINGILPEMHAWIAFPEHGIVVDPTTRYIRRIAREMLGIDVDSDEFDISIEHPDCFIGDEEEAAASGYTYIPDPRAISLVLALAHDNRNWAIGEWVGRARQSSEWRI